MESTPLSMAGRASDPASPLSTSDMEWIPTGAGKSFRPLQFRLDGWSELMRLEPGSVVALHRHTGEVHAFNLSGSREVLGTGEIAGPGSYAFEPAGTIDAWQAIGHEPCIVHLKITGVVEYLGPDGEVTETADAASQRAVYLNWCDQHGVTPAAQIIGPFPQLAATGPVGAAARDLLTLPGQAACAEAFTDSPAAVRFPGEETPLA